MQLTDVLAKRVAQRMTRDGFDCLPGDVWDVWRNGTIPNHEALASRILQEFEELGIGED